MSEQWKDDLAAVGDTIESLRDELAAARAQVEKEALEMGGVIHDLRRELARTIDSFLVTQARAQAAEALAESYRKALLHERTALALVRDRQCHDGVCTISLADIEKGIALLDAAITGEKPCES